MPETNEYRCPRCGAHMTHPADPCPRCGGVFSASDRQARIEDILNQSSPLDSVPPVPAIQSLPNTVSAPPQIPPFSPGAAPFQAVPAPPPADVPAGQTAISPVRRRRVRRLLVFFIILAAAALLIAGIQAVYRSSLGYNASPDKLVDGLNAALRSSDEELLLTLIPSDEQDAGLYLSSSMSSYFRQYHVEYIDSFIGQKDQYAEIIVRLPDYDDQIQLITARKADGKWYFAASSLSRLPYLQQSSSSDYWD